MILSFFCLDFTITGISHQTSNKYNHIHPSFPPFLLYLLPYWQHKSTADQIRNKNQSAAQLLLSAALALTRAVIISENSARLSLHMCNPFQGTPNPFTPLQAVSAISCMVSRILTPPGRHHSGVSLLIRRFAQKTIATAMFQCKPLFLFILGPIVLGLIRNPIWQDSGGLASSFNFQSLESAFGSEFLICSLLNF